MAGLSSLNGLPEADAQAALLRCCGSARWAAAMARGRPYPDAAALFAAAEKAWWALAARDWKQAFARHPRIGDRKFAGTAAWAAGEQAGAAAAPDRVLDALAAGNRGYEARFGYIFIVCATGKSAGEMLALLNGRLGNDPERELRVAAAEQAKITRLRLEKLLKGG